MVLKKHPISNSLNHFLENAERVSDSIKRGKSDQEVSLEYNVPLRVVVATRIDLLGISNRRGYANPFKDWRASSQSGGIQIIPIRLTEEVRETLGLMDNNEKVEWTITGHSLKKFTVEIREM